MRRALEQPQPVPEAPELVLPPVLFKRWRKRYSEAELAQLAAALLAQPEFTFRAERGFEPGELAAEAVPAFGEFRFFRACSAARLLESAALRDGRIYIQDPATSLAPSLPDFNGVKSVLDLCAAPGGKSLMLGERLAGGGAAGRGGPFGAPPAADCRKLPPPRSGLSGHGGRSGGTDGGVRRGAG